MKSADIRKKFLEFFEAKQHKIVPSAPMVLKNDPTLMFTNAGMNQFKDLFLGNSSINYHRVANTQKCLRVSGKHNDLEEVGHDTYHHTMFEMLGNWSFGDYFKEEAINWAWELLTEVYKIDPNDLYVSIFEGDSKEGIPKDEEAFQFWKKIVNEEKIILGNKKDNFWEMGETGPCGPCSEIHVDLRNQEEKNKIKGSTLVNKGNPLVIEIWNLVFIQFNRKSDGNLELLPARHIDTGMGFERLSMALQNVTSNYDTDIFQPLIQQISVIAGEKYGSDNSTDVAMRVIADHLRAISFAIADGQLPSNNKAGYVIRRILRRAVRYGYTFLGLKTPFIFSLVPLLAKQMGDVFPELYAQKELIMKVIEEEENSFLRTLEQGIHKFEQYKPLVNNEIDGGFAFELFDTYGFPLDLTQLLAKEKNYSVDLSGFEKCMQEQKNRSRQAAHVEKDDWVTVFDKSDSEFIGYDYTEISTKILKYRKIVTKNSEFFQIVLEKTPFYGESGGQTGDKGNLIFNNESIEIIDTKKENDLIVHLVKNLPENLNQDVVARINLEKREKTQKNHTATHLLHKALKEVLGSHVEQKGSLVSDDRLRFDFAHFSALSPEEINKVESLVFQAISQNLRVDINFDSLENAKTSGAIALFGEKYGETVRVVSVGGDFSRELCGGTHVSNTGQIGLFVIVEESAIAAGIRRIEAITGETAFTYLKEKFVEPLEQIKRILKKPNNELPAYVQTLNDQNLLLQKQLEDYKRQKALVIKENLTNSLTLINGISFISGKAEIEGDFVKDMAFQLKNEIDNLFFILGFVNNNKVGLTLMISDSLINAKGWNATALIRDFARHIEGGGGGQNFYATAGGKKIEGIDDALNAARDFVLRNS